MQNFGQIGLPIITQFVIEGRVSYPKKDDIDMIVNKLCNQIIQNKWLSVFFKSFLVLQRLKQSKGANSCEIINTISTLKCIIVSKVESNTGLKTGNVPDFSAGCP